MGGILAWKLKISVSNRTQGLFAVVCSLLLVGLIISLLIPT